MIARDDFGRSHRTGAAGERAIRQCIQAIDDYLARFDFTGVHDVRAGIAQWAAGEIMNVAPRNVPADAYMPAALQCLADDGETALASAIGEALPYFHWTTYDIYPADEIGAPFASGHGFVSLIGDGAHINADDFDLGLFLIAPNIFYRDHEHAAPELYVPLTGPHRWRFAPGDPLVWKPAHEPVWNEPWQPHATKAGEMPFLCIFGWTRDVWEPAVVVPAEDWALLETLPTTVEPESA